MRTSRSALGRLGVALAGLLILTGSAAGQDLSRADPALRFLLMTRPPPVSVEPELAADRPARLSAGPRAALERLQGILWVNALVRVGPGGESALLQAGAEVRTRAGDIVTARIPFDAVPELLGARGIVAIEAAKTLLPTAPVYAPTSTPNDTAMADAGFTGLRRRVGSRWEGLVGTGVIVGIYDSGLDLSHDDFLRPDGTTRVLYAWDQTDSLTPPPGMVGGNNFTYGAECTPAVIDSADCGMHDFRGHGTHVAGIAAGDGSATGLGQPAWRFPGGAPGADLIVVKGSDGAFDGNKMIEGVAYIFARAAELGRPAVVNLSLSSPEGPHDGSHLIEQALNALTGPGRIIVAGAGNFGYHQNTALPMAGAGLTHVQGTGSGTHGVVVPSYEPRPGAANDGLVLEMWYEGQDSLSVTITSPAGQSLTVATGDSATLDTNGGAIQAMNAFDGPDLNNGDHAAFIAIGDLRAEAPPVSGTWTVQVTADAVHGTGVYHIWLQGASFVSQQATAFQNGTNGYLVGIPATADNVIAVGAHVTRHQWLGVGEDVESLQGQEELGDIAWFSSPGPRRDGVSKPDLTAPGKMVVSSRSEDADLWDPPELSRLVEADSVHAALLGTSMASPGVAAAAALLLQIDPDLTPDDIRDLLRLSATVDGFVGSPTPNPVWGAGKLDAGEATERLAPDGLAGASEPVNLSENPVRGDALVINYGERPNSVAVYTLVAERVRSFSSRELGPLNVIWPLDTDAGGDVANGAYVVVVEFPGRRVVRKIFVARP